MKDSVNISMESVKNLGTVNLVNTRGNMEKQNKRPIQYLPIPHPANYEPEDPLFFYRNIVQPLLEDFIRLEANGIPINLDKVAELEVTVIKVLDEVKEKLSKNPIMLEFLKQKASVAKKEKSKELTLKKKSYEDFIKPFDLKNKVHRTYLINNWLKALQQTDMLLDDWTIKDLKKLIQIHPSVFLQSILDKTIHIDNPACIAAMEQLAKDKAEAWNKNVDDKVDTLDEEEFIQEFNPGSALQKQQFFEFCGIESDAETKAGAPQFDRDQLEQIQRILKDMIEEEENAKIQTYGYCS